MTTAMPSSPCRPVALVTGQWADLPLAELTEMAASWGYDGLELACWGDHFDVDACLENDGYARALLDRLQQHGLKLASLNHSLVSQCICDDPIDERHRAILPPAVWGDGQPEAVRERAAAHLSRAAQAARVLGCDTVKGLTGSRIWPLLYPFPPVSPDVIASGYRDFGDRFRPILDAFAHADVRFAMEPHPSSIAYDFVTATMALRAVGEHPAFGFNVDPSHLVHQGIDPAAFLHEMKPRVFGVHMKDVRINRSGLTSVLASHLPFGDPRRGWDFCSVGRGDVPWEGFIRAIHDIGYRGWLGIEWEDAGMDRAWGAREALAFVRGKDFPESKRAFDAAFTRSSD